VRIERPHELEQSQVPATAAIEGHAYNLSMLAHARTTAHHRCPAYRAERFAKQREAQRQCRPIVADRS
jgi:hypothetical protein